MEYFDPKALTALKRGVRQAPGGFRYGFVSGIFREQRYAEIVESFPDVAKFRLVDMMAGGGHKRFHVGETYYSGTDYGAIHQFSRVSDVWQAVLAEATSEEFMALLRDATGIRFNSLCNFGFAYGDGGCEQEPHLDGSAMKKKSISDSIACLLYVNRSPGGVSGTRVYDLDRKTVLFEVPDLRNGFFFFEQHPKAWHGFPRVPDGADRRIVSLTYSDEPKPIRLHRSRLYGLLPLSAKKLIQRIS